MPGRGYKDFKLAIEDLEEVLEDAKCNLSRLKEGEDLARYSWDRYDNRYDYYCSGCNKHMGMVEQVYQLPLAKFSKCTACKRSPEEKAQLEDIKRARKVADDMLKLAELKKEYPEHFKET